MNLIIPRGIDISVYNRILPDGFKKAADADVWFVIQKATQGTSFVDKTMKERRQAILDAGMLLGFYHFPTGDSIEKQVDHFLKKTNPDEKTLLALDYEPNPRGASISPGGMIDFLALVNEKVGRKPIIYSGHLLKEVMPTLSKGDQQFIASHRLWLAQYSSICSVPKGFKDWWIWQFTGDGRGPEPHYVPGVDIPGNKGIDVNSYRGTREQLEIEWVTNQEPMDIMEPEEVEEDNSSYPVGSPKWIQDALNQVGCAEPPLVIDGRFGPRTIKAIKRFQNGTRGLAVDGEVGPKTLAALKIAMS